MSWRATTWEQTSPERPRLANEASGIEINFADENTIGGTTAAERNVIGGNETGVSITDSYRNVVQGNYVGVDSAGTAALPNGTGVLLSQSRENKVGGAASGAGNVISGNDGTGVTIIGHPPVTGQTAMNLIVGNLIGTAADGLTPLGNGSHGVLLDGLADAYIGTTDPRAGNTIACNDGDGISAYYSRFASIRGNSIHSNAGLGIDIGADGVRENLPPGHFALLEDPNYPVLTTAFSGAGSTTIEGEIVTPFYQFCPSANRDGFLFQSRRGSVRLRRRRNLSRYAHRTGCRIDHNSAVFSDLSRRGCSGPRHFGDV